MKKSLCLGFILGLISILFFAGFANASSTGYSWKDTGPGTAAFACNGNCIGTKYPWEYCTAANLGKEIYIYSGAMANYGTPPNSSCPNSKWQGYGITLSVSDTRADWWGRGNCGGDSEYQNQPVEHIYRCGLDYQDIGIRVFDGTQVIKIAVEQTGTLTSPLRIAKAGVVYGIVLVDPGDSTASKILIETPSGIKALCKYSE